LILRPKPTTKPMAKIGVPDILSEQKNHWRIYSKINVSK